jgi:uncharacterized protein YcfJ
MSNKSMLIGMIAGIGVATAGGVAAYQFLGQGRNEQGSVAVVEEATPAQAPQGSSEIVLARVEPTPAPAPRAQAPAAPRQPTAAPRQPTAVAPRPAPVAVAVAAPAEECWDEEVTVQLDPKDEHAIAGTAVGAVVGGAIGKDVGDRDLTTAAGAAAGAFIGRKIQKHIQENRAEQRTETRIERRCAPAGTPH